MEFGPSCSNMGNSQKRCSTTNKALNVGNECPHVPGHAVLAFVNSGHIFDFCELLTFSSSWIVIKRICFKSRCRRLCRRQKSVSVLKRMKKEWKRRQAYLLLKRWRTKSVIPKRSKTLSPKSQKASKGSWRLAQKSHPRILSPNDREKRSSSARTQTVWPSLGDLIVCKRTLTPIMLIL